VFSSSTTLSLFILFFLSLSLFPLALHHLLLIIVVDSIQREESARIEITGKSRAGGEKKKRQTNSQRE
jgi:hypothetical protein